MKSILLSILFICFSVITFAKRMNPIYMLQGDWQIKSLGVKSAKPFKSAKNSVTITADSRISINIGCNQIGASINNIGINTISFGQGMSTKMMCSPALMAKDKLVTDILSKIDKYVTKENNTVLELYSKNKKVMVLKKMASIGKKNTEESKDDASLEGNYRLIQQLEGNETVEHLQDKMTMQFSGNANVSGNDGCNNYSGTYNSLQVNSILFNEIITTQMACVPDNQKASNALFTNIKNADRYKLETNKLLLYKGRQLLMLFERVN
jgi:heat shock protein HslJ